MAILSIGPKYSIAVAFLTVMSLAATAPADVELYASSVYVVDGPRDRVYYHGADIHIQTCVGNWGTETSGDFTLNFYISRDYHMSADDRYLGSAEDSGVAPDEYRWTTYTFAIPDDLPEGMYWIGFIIESAEDGDPHDNDDADWHGNFWVIIPRPDLAIQSVDVADGAYRPGEEAAVDIIIRNLGRLNLGGGTIECYASTEGSGGVSEIHVGSASVPSLVPREERRLSATCRFPDSLPEGYYIIRVKGSCPGDVRADNDEGGDLSPVWVGAFADLAVQSVQASPGTYGPSDEIVVSSHVQNVGDLGSDGYTVDYHISADVDITSRDQHIGRAACGGLGPGEQRAEESLCRLPSYIPEGEYYVGAIVTCANDGRSRNNVAHDGAAVTLIHAAGYVSGQMKYRDLEGAQYPIRFARVRVSDAEDEPIGHTHTDADGNYGFRLPDAPTTGPKIRVRVFTQSVGGAYPGVTSAIGDVIDEVHRLPHVLRSGWQPYPADASATVHLTAPSDGGAFMVFDSIVEGFHKAKTFFDIELPPITTCWPSADGGTYYHPEHGIYISQDDRGDRDVIMHEYGHHLTDVHDFAEGAVGEDPIHYWNRDLRSWPSSRTDREARNLAFRESWATLFSIATQYGDSTYPYSGDSRYQDVYEGTPWVVWIDLEEGTGGRKSPGEFYENMNCCALWDIFDDRNYADDDQDTLSDLSLTKIWTISLAVQPEDILDFWNGWFEYYEHEAEITRIFRDHKIVFRPPVPSLVVEGFETGDFSAFEWTRTGDAMWTVAAQPGCQGAHCARSGDVGDNEQTTLAITIVCDDGWLKFWRKVSSEMACDRLQFFIDGVRKADWSGERDWKQFEYPVAAGRHTFTWTYTKDSSSVAGDDAAWLDDVEFPVWHTEEP